jgi:hypothetical protein
MISETVAALVPVVAVATPRVHHLSKSIGFPGLANVVLLVIVLGIVGAIWARRRSRNNKRVSERPDEWPPRDPRRRPMDTRDDPPWQ